MVKGRMWIIGCGLAAVLSAPGSIPRVLADSLAGSSTSGGAQQGTHDAKAEAAARQKATSAVEQAIVALGKEYEAHQSDPTVPIREKSNYFKDNPVAEMSNDVIFNGLNEVSGPIAEACYIKWQLLSGLPAKADEKLAPQIGSLYANAPAPIPNPSLTAADKMRLNSALMRMTEEQADNVNDQWTKALGDWAGRNAPIINYSEALYGMLPESLGAFTLGLQDVYQRRVANGVDSQVFENQVISDARDWALTAPPEQVRAAAEQCDRWLRAYSATFPPAVFTDTKWDPKSRQLRFEPRGTQCLAAKDLTDFEKFLLGQANQPGGGLKFKQNN